MKRLVLGLVAASVVIASGAAHAQTGYAIPRSKQTQLTVLAPKGPTWPTDKNGNPIPNSRKECPPGYQFIQVTIPNPFPGGGFVSSNPVCLRS